MSTSAETSPPSSPPSPGALEADIEAARLRLAGTVDAIAARVTPQAIVRREVEALKARVVAATTTPEGDLRVERIAAIAVAVVALIGLGVLRRRSRG